MPSLCIWVVEIVEYMYISLKENVPLIFKKLLELGSFSLKGIKHFNVKRTRIFKVCQDNITE